MYSITEYINTFDLHYVYSTLYPISTTLTIFSTVLAIASHEVLGGYLLSTYIHSSVNTLNNTCRNDTCKVQDNI